MTELPEVETPSSNAFLLPQRAYLLSYRDQSLTTRRAALADSYEEFKATEESEDVHEAQLALLGLIGDAMQAVEDVGIFGDAMMVGLQGLPFYVRATIYDPSNVNNFFAQVHKHDAAYFLRLCGFRFDEFSMHDAFGWEPPLSDDERAAFEAAEDATAALVGEHLRRLAGEWDRYRRFFHAAKHASLVGNPDDVDVLDEQGEVIDGIVVWARRQPDAAIGNHATTPLDDVAEHIESVGQLAIEMVEYLVKSRLRHFDYLDFQADGSITTKPLRSVPWEFWMRGHDVSDKDLKLLQGRGIRMESVD